MTQDTKTREKKKKSFYPISRFFKGRRLEIGRVLCHHLANWKSTKGVADEEFYALVDDLAKIEGKMDKMAEAYSGTPYPDVTTTATPSADYVHVDMRPIEYNDGYRQGQKDERKRLREEVIEKITGLKGSDDYDLNVAGECIEEYILPLFSEE